MAITRIQNQVNFTQKPKVENQGNVNMERLVQLPRMHYRNCTDIPDSVNNIRPERGQGHLIGNNPIKALGRFFSNRYYDLKSVYKGYTGTANDHQLGRTNDVGLVAGGLGIAAFLSTKRGAVLPKHMEFIGLGSFLASMSLWPKIGVFGPARLVHGFDVDKRYIDDQGRNKSVFQDPNYVPFDLFDGTRKSENLDDIATYMGISKDAKNRDEMAKDQMVKIARQNNTLWMLSSGLAVPTMTALISNGVERAYTPYLFSKKAEKYTADLDALYNHIIMGKELPTAIKMPNKQGSVAKVFGDLTAKQFLTQNDIKEAMAKVSEGLNSEFASGLSREIGGRLADANASIVVADEQFITDLAKNFETKFQGHEQLKKAILSVDELKEIIGKDSNFKEGVSVNKADLLTKIKEASSAKFDGAPAVKNRLASMLKTHIDDGNGTTILPKSEKMVMDSSVKEVLNKIAEPIETYSNYYKAIQQANELQMGSDSVNANHWGKLEKAFTEIALPDKRLSTLKGLMDNGPELEKVMISHLEEIAKNEEAYKNAVSKINEIKLAYLKDILGAGEEHLYSEIVNGTVRGAIDGRKDGNWSYRVLPENSANKMDKYIMMQKRLSNNLAEAFGQAGLGKGANTFRSIMQYKVPVLDSVEQVSKMENFVSACDRIIHSLDLYKRAEAYKTSKAKDPVVSSVVDGNVIPEHWLQEIFDKAKRETIASTSNDVFLRFGYKDKPAKYQAFMKIAYAMDGDNVHMDTATVDALKPKRLQEIESIIAKSEGNVSAELLAEREALVKLQDASKATTQSWITRFRSIIPDVWHVHNYELPNEASPDDRMFKVMFPDYSRAVDQNWMFPGYDDGLNNGKYSVSELKTPDAKYKIQAKNLVELTDQGAKKVHNSGKWLRTFGGLFVGVFAASVLAQFFFGKKDATIPTEKARLRQARMNAMAERMEAANAN